MSTSTMMARVQSGAQSKALRIAITRKFKANSLFLRGPATALIAEKIAQYSDDLSEAQLSQALDMIVSAVAEKDLTSNFIEADVIQDVLQKLESQGGSATSAGNAVGDWTDDADRTETPTLQVIGAFDVPKLQYSTDRKHFVAVRGTPVLHSDSAEPKALLWRERFTILRQRTLRNKLFSRALEGSAAEKSAFKLTPLSALLGSSRQSIRHETGLIVMGMLSQIDEGKYCLEDLDGRVRLALTDVAFGHGLFHENAIVIAEGTYEDDVFYAKTIAFPPPEPRSQSMLAFGSLNFFGGQTSATEQDTLYRIETDDTGALFVVLSDVWLDKPQVMDRLRRMFEGYATMDPPPVFVLMGNFLSQPYGAEQAKVLKDAFDGLSDLITSVPDLSQKARFIFVPGPKDLGSPNILPRRPLPSQCTKKIRDRLDHTTFTTNPARIRYCTQEMVVFREDIVHKLRRNCVLTPSSSDRSGEVEISKHVVKTLLDEAHVNPLPLHVSPIYWEYDHALRLYPMPDVLVLADKFDTYNHSYESTTVFNPGPFMLSDFQFVAYWPSRFRIDPSASDEAKELYENRVEYSKIQ
eukprot:m.463027 g.463027  ORF g.463027 m.463027 type:complete len:579 (+) comp21608_c0_seq2:323-2059(+)